MIRQAPDFAAAHNNRALARTDGHGLEELLRALGQSFADHARYASLLLQRPADPATARQMTAVIDQLTARAAASGTVNPGITISPASLSPDDVNLTYNSTIWASGGTGAVTLAVSNVANAIPGLNLPTNGSILDITGIPTATGRFGATMHVELVNDGPVTLIVDSK